MEEGHCAMQTANNMAVSILAFCQYSKNYTFLTANLLCIQLIFPYAIYSIITDLLKAV